ncbi:MAG: glycoside hydrolase [Eubacteriales bacterium]|nr:glycoside hydrolase [Eubacteriales bacterium]
MDSIIPKEDIRYSKLKDVKKALRSINQSLTLILLLIILFRAVFSLTVYKPYDSAAVTGTDNGLICLSYSGVDTVGTQTLISDDRLAAHLQALKDSGYVTVSQQDVLDYIKTGKLLPERALYLMFSDGRRDTAVFAQKIMEEKNMLATMFTYADKCETRDNKFLMAKEIKLLLDTTFWELGTNGYRLSYINCADRYGNFLGELDSNAFVHAKTYIDSTYDHYLMDYIRDEYGIPQETFEQMQARLQGDYQAMERLYTDEVGVMPKVYAIMHANTGAYGTNTKASAVNEAEIKRLFAMNFNWVDQAKNTQDADLYDMTRMEPKAYWSSNHLLMRLWETTGLPMAFNKGLTDKAADWETLAGAAEFDEQEIVVTSLPNAYGAIKLTRRSFGDMAMSVMLRGNQAGTQRILLRADNSRSAGAALEITDNVLYLYNLQDGRERPKLLLNLDIHDGVVEPPFAEQRQKALQAEIEIKRSGASPDKEEITNALQQSAATTVEQLPQAEVNLDPSKAGNRKVQLWLSGRHLSVWIDGKLVIEHLDMGTLPESGSVYLEAASVLAKAQMDIKDSVYDGRFRDLYITDTQTDALLYDYRPDENTRRQLNIKEKWSALIDWFIKIL